MDYVDQLFERAADLAGSPADHLKVIALLFLSIPLALIFPLLPPSTRSNLPHLFAFLPSVFFLWNVLRLRDGFVQLLASSLVTWVIVKLGVREKRGKRMPWVVFTFVMGHLAVNHLIRHFDRISLDRIEITGSQMVLCMKLISFAWSVYDGQRPLDKLDATQQASRIVDVPGLIPFLGYCFFFPSILAGPSFTYASYVEFTSHDLYRREKSDDKKKRVMPKGRRRKALKRLATGVFYLAIYSTYGGSISYFKMLEPEFLGQSFVSRFLFLNLAGFVARAKYYAVWCIAESAFIMSGLGYNPVTTRYDASRNVRIRDIELAPNFKILFDSWNMNTNVWLRECIYKRVAREGKKPGFKSTQITFITSALWHGVNPCYLLTFILGGFCQSLARTARKLIRPFFLPPGSVAPPRPAVPTAPVVNTNGAPSAEITPPVAPKKVVSPPQTLVKWAYDGVTIVATKVALNFIVVPFIVLEVSSSLQVWSSVNHYGLYMIGVPFLVLHFGGAAYLRGALKRRDAHASRSEKESKTEEANRVEWERLQETKRANRGEGIPALGIELDFEAVESGDGKKEL